MKKNDKKFLGFVIVAATISFFFLGPKYNRNELAKIELQNQVKKVLPQGHMQQTGRSPASLVPKKSPPTGKSKVKREIIGKVEDLANVRIINKENDQWQENYRKNFLRMLGDQPIKDFEIKLKKSVLKVDNNIGQKLEHIVVSYTRPNGNPYSFEALVDSSNGQVIQTWNQTRYEFKEEVKLKAHGRKFYDN